MIVQNWADVAVASLQQLWFSFVGFLPELIGALVIFIIGLIVAAGLAMLVEKVLESIRLNTLVNKTGVDEYFKRGGLELNVARFFGRLTYWFIVIAFFLAAADILRFTALSGFLQSVLLYIPRIAVAVLILLTAIVVANFLKAVVRASVMGAKMHSAKFLGALTWWSVVVFGLLAALSQLGIAVTIINIILTGFVVMVALAGGIAFGLGGKDYASHLIGRLRDEVEHR
ncbi:MAG: hypothetical protein Q8P66_01735 [Candidatus Colwellbacteria bacterium]|nr:hypothetical protein [Candidatus Colwellbacteria bacterium]